MPLHLPFARAKPTSAASPLRTFTPSVSTDSPFTSGISTDSAARCGAMRVTMVSSVQSRSRLNTRSTRTNAGNSAAGLERGAAAFGVALARQLERT